MNWPSKIYKLLNINCGRTKEVDKKNFVKKTRQKIRRYQKNALQKIGIFAKNAKSIHKLFVLILETSENPDCKAHATHRSAYYY